jgi:acyl dehydratase
MLELDTTFEAPVFAGDTITVDIEIADVSETSDPSRGIVVFDYDVTNQDDELVCRMQETALVAARNETGDE